MSTPNLKGPNPDTIADGYSVSDERTPVTGPDIDFDYAEDGHDSSKDDDASSSVGLVVNAKESGLEFHIGNPDDPKFHQSHVGEHHKDFGDIPVSITTSTYIFAGCAALNSINLGYDIGVNTNAAPLLQESLGLSEVQLEIFIGSINLFAMFGSLGAQYISDHYGRRRTFIVAAVGFIIGVGITVMTSSFAVLMVGRVFIGLGIGVGLAIDPLYISEVSPASHRGELVTWSEIAINIGIVLGFSTGLIFSGVDSDTAWRYMYGLGIIMPIILIFVASTIMPESPRWLISKGYDNEAKSVLQRIYPYHYDISPVVEDIKECIEREALAERAMGWDVILFPTPAFKRMLVVGVGIAIAQQAVGIDAIQYFLLFILDEAGINTREGQAGVLIFLGLVKLACVVVAGKLFDKRGRRPLFFVSLLGMAGSLLLLSINFFGQSYSGAFAVFALALYLAFFSLGIGPGAWLIPAEVFTTSIRAKAMSVATFMNRVTATLMSSTFLSTARAMTWAGFFLLLAIVSVVITLFVHKFLPETKGRSLEDMSVYFAEITNDTSILEAEEKLIREREARERAIEMANKDNSSDGGGGNGGGPERVFVPPTARDIPPERLKDATVVGTMS